MTYRETDPIEPVSPQISDVATTVDLSLLNGVKAEFAIPCTYVLPPVGGSVENVLEPIHLTAEGYGDPVVAFADAPAGLTGTAWIDELDDSIVRVVFSAQCPGATTKDVTCEVSILISRDTGTHGERTDVVLRGPLTVKAAPYLAAALPAPPDATALSKALYSSMLGYGVMKDIVASITNQVLSITAGSAIINGAFWDASLTPVTMDLHGLDDGSTRKLVLRYTAETNEIIADLIPNSQEIKRWTSIWELPLCQMSGMSGMWVPMIFTYEMAGTLSDPVGSYKSFSVETGIPKSHLIADGRAVSRVLYPRLWAKIGGTFGTGDGSTTFNLPDHTGRVGVGLDVGDPDFGSIAQSTWDSGAKTVTLTTPQIPSHNHTQSAHSHTYGIRGNDLDLGYIVAIGSDGPSSGSNDTSVVAPAIQNTGGGGSHNNIQPYAVEVICIRA